MVTIVVAEIAFSVAVYKYRIDLKETLRSGFLYTMREYEANKDTWDNVQEEVRGNFIFFSHYFEYIFK